MENPSILLRRLNSCCIRAMEAAASLCQTRSHAEFLPMYWQLNLLKQLKQGESDLTRYKCNQKPLLLRLSWSLTVHKEWVHEQ